MIFSLIRANSNQQLLSYNCSCHISQNMQH